MHASNFVLDDYLSRIGYHGPRDASAATLAQLMRAQLFTVPFENLDVQTGKIVSMTPENIVQKSSISHAAATATKSTVCSPWPCRRWALATRLAARPMFYRCAARNPYGAVRARRWPRLAV